jgi:hypothetical protein
MRESGAYFMLRDSIVKTNFLPCRQQGNCEGHPMFDNRAPSPLGFQISPEMELPGSDFLDDRKKEM